MVDVKKSCKNLRCVFSHCGAFHRKGDGATMASTVFSTTPRAIGKGNCITRKGLPQIFRGSPLPPTADLNACINTDLISGDTMVINEPLTLRLVKLFRG